MEGVAVANFRGLERLLKEKPNSTEAWTYARGQALLIAETGNLLLICFYTGSGQPILEHTVYLYALGASALGAISGG